MEFKTIKEQQRDDEDYRYLENNENETLLRFELSILKSPHETNNEKYKLENEIRENIENQKLEDTEKAEQERLLQVWQNTPSRIP